MLDRSTKMFKKRLVTDVYTKDISFPYFLPQGFAGTVTRIEDMVIEQQPFNATSANQPTYYGQAVVVDSAGIRVTTAGDTGVNADSNSAVINGFLVRPYPTQQQSTTGTIGSGAPNTLLPGNILRRGFMIVPLQNSTAASKGGRVYVRLVASGSLGAGGVEAASAAGLYPLGNTFFTGPADATGLVEISYNVYNTTT